MICHRRVLRGIWSVFCIGANLIFGLCAWALIRAYSSPDHPHHCGWLESQMNDGCYHIGFGFLEFFLCLSALAIAGWLMLLQARYLWQLMQRKPLPHYLNTAKEFALTALNPILLTFPMLHAIADAA